MGHMFILQDFLRSRLSLGFDLTSYTSEGRLLHLQLIENRRISRFGMHETCLKHIFCKKTEAYISPDTRLPVITTNQ